MSLCKAQCGETFCSLLHHCVVLNVKPLLGTHLRVNDANGGLVSHVLLKALRRSRVEAQHGVVAVCVLQKQHGVGKDWKVTSTS